MIDKGEIFVSFEILKRNKLILLLSFLINFSIIETIIVNSILIKKWDIALLIIKTTISFLISWSTLFVAFLINRSLVDNFLNFLFGKKNMLKKILIQRIKEFLLTVVVLIIILIFFSNNLKSFVNIIKNFIPIDDLLISFLIILIIILIFYLLNFISKHFKKKKSKLSFAIEDLIASVKFTLTIYSLIIFIIFIQFLGKEILKKNSFFLMTFLKDIILLYLILFLFLLFYKIAENKSLHLLFSQKKEFIFFALVVIVIAILAVHAEFVFINSPTFISLFKLDWERNVFGAHILIRDILFLFTSVVIFLIWILRKLAEEIESRKG